MYMKITRKKLMETVQEEMKTVLLEEYLRAQISQVLIEQAEGMSTTKIETLLSSVIDNLENIDMSIDYLTSAMTGHDPFSLGITQKVAGRGGGRFATSPLSQREISETAELSELNPHKTLAQQEPEDFEEPEEDPVALKATDTLGGDWAGQIDAEPGDHRPPREYRKKAIELLASFNVNVDQQAIDAVAWQLYNNEMQGPTAAMEEPPKKRKRFGFFENAERRPNAELLNLLRSMLKTAEDPYADEQQLLLLGGDLQDMLDQLVPSAQWAQEKGYNQPTYSEEVERHIREELEVYVNEEYSDKQRNYMCAVKDAPDGERPESLSQSEAEELCTGPMKKPKTKRGKQNERIK